MRADYERECTEDNELLTQRAITQVSVKSTNDRDRHRTRRHGRVERDSGSSGEHGQ